METNLKLLTAFTFMACDGEISSEEIALLTDILGPMAQQDLQNLTSELNREGKEFIFRYMDTLKNANLNKDQALELLRIGVDTIYADSRVEYSEIKFFRLIRTCLPLLSDEEILATDPRVEEFWLEPDLSATPEVSYFASAGSSFSVTLPQVKF